MDDKKSTTNWTEEQDRRMSTAEGVQAPARTVQRSPIDILTEILAVIPIDDSTISHPAYKKLHSAVWSEPMRNIVELPDDFGISWRDAYRIVLELTDHDPGSGPPALAIKIRDIWVGRARTRPSQVTEGE